MAKTRRDPIYKKKETSNLSKGINAKRYKAHRDGRMQRSALFYFLSKIGINSWVIYNLRRDERHKQ